MEYKCTVFTKVFTLDALRYELNNIIQILTLEGITQIELLFGYAWGIKYKNWTPYQISLNDLMHEIKKAEDFEVGTFGDDNLHILIDNESVEVFFCNERDIHLSFNETNKLVINILQDWKSRGIYLTEKTNSG